MSVRPYHRVRLQFPQLILHILERCLQRGHITAETINISSMRMTEQS